MRSVSLCAALLFSTACAHLRTPSGPVVPDRPGFGDVPATLPSGAIEIEAGFTSDRAIGATYQSMGESLLRVGLGRGIEFRFLGNSFGALMAAGAPAVRGMEDSKVGVKVNLIDQPDSVHGAIPSLSVLVGTSLPNGARGIGAGVALPEAHVAANWNTPSPISIVANLGLNAAFDGITRSTAGWMSTTTSYAVNSHVSLFVQAMHQFDVRGGVSSATHADGGVSLTLGERLELDARVGRGVAGSATHDRIFGFGIARRF